MQLIKLKILLTVSLFFLTLPIVADPCAAPNRSDLRFTINSHTDNPIILLVHGLNNNLAMFTDIADELKKNNFNLAYLTLAGHSGCASEKYSASAEIWVKQVNSAVTNIKTKYPNAPLYALGYSMGGLLLTVASHRSDQMLFEKQVLLAPALSLRFYSHIANWFTPLSAYDMSLPSQAPKEYLAYSSTALSSYKALFDLLDELDTSKINPRRLPNTLIISHRDDILVSTRGIKKFILTNQLTHWSILERKDEVIWPHFNSHYIFAEHAFTEEEWKRQIQAIVNFFH